MAFNKNRLHELEIACSIKRVSMNALGRKWGVSSNWIRDVASGRGTSNEIENKIEQFISGAKKIVPFDYPYDRLQAGRPEVKGKPQLNPA